MEHRNFGCWATAIVCELPNSFLSWDEVVSRLRLMVGKNSAYPLRMLGNSRGLVFADFPGDVKSICRFRAEDFEPHLFKVSKWWLALI